MVYIPPPQCQKTEEKTKIRVKSLKFGGHPHNVKNRFTPLVLVPIMGKILLSTLNNPFFTEWSQTFYVPRKLLPYQNNKISEKHALILSSQKMI